MAAEARSPFLDLPPEIREQIYRIIFEPENNRLVDEDEYTDYNYSEALVLFRLNQQIYYESRKIFRDLNVFVRIQTPFPNAPDYVAYEGHVPILMRDARATRFRGHSLDVTIRAPQMPTELAEPHHIVILLDDLETFTRIWLHSDLTNPRLNNFLNLDLHLRDPHTPDWEEKRVGRALQRRLLLPFGMVKDLLSVEITGDPRPLPTVVAELEREQRVPVPSPEACLAEAARLKEEGNAELKAGDYHAALRTYTRAWAAVYIVVKGRQRHVHAEPYFARELREPPYAGRNGQAERLQLRVQLVANTCLAYLRLEDWDELLFWGMRTIRMMRQAAGGPQAAHGHELQPEFEAMLQFPAAVQLGKIYYRTALAYKALGDRDEARKLLRVAKIYLPRDENVAKELDEYTLKLG